MTKHNLDEKKILGGKATIYKNIYGVWQFRLWLTNDEKYVRKSLRTKIKNHAIKQAEELYFKIRSEQERGEKYYAISLKEAVYIYLQYQKLRIGLDEFNIDESRWKTIKTQMRTFLEYVGTNDKVTTLKESLLVEHERNGKITNYVAFRKSKDISDSTIRNEMITFNSFIKYCFTRAKVTNLAFFKYPNMPKKEYKVNGDEIKKATFSDREYKQFILAMLEYTSNKNIVYLTTEEIFERKLAQHYFLFAANSGLRSSEIRKLQWHNIKTYKNTTAHGYSGIFARLKVEKNTSQARKTRTVYCRGGEYIDSWKDLCVKFGREIKGVVFSKDGKECSRSNAQKHFSNILKLCAIEPGNKKLTPYSLRHFMITERVKSGFNFNQIAIMCGTSVRQIETTYQYLNEELMRSSVKPDYIKFEDGTQRVI